MLTPYTVMFNLTGSIMIYAASKEEAVQKAENMWRSDIADEAEELGFAAFAVKEKEEE